MAASQAEFVRRLRLVYGLDVRTRRQWGSKYARIYAWRLIFRRSKFPVDTIVQHITVTHDSGRLTGNFDADMRLLEQIGYQRFGSGISYNACFDKRTGMVGIGQPLRAKGTHTVNDKNVRGFTHDQNLVARGLAWIGVPGDKPSAACQESIAAFIACMMDTGHCTPDPDYLPHSTFAYKDCPTQPMRDVMPSIYRRAKALHLANGGKKTPRR